MVVRLPNLPRRAGGVIISPYTKPAVIKALNAMGISCIKGSVCGNIMRAVMGHPDMSISHIGEDAFVCEPSSHSYYTKLLKNVHVYKGQASLTVNYPNDIAYNIARVGDIAFHNIKYTDSVLKQLLLKEGVKLVHINQGYSKCSICVVNERAIITSDEAIARVAMQNDIDTLVICKGHIDLEGHDYGFIGGASGKLAKDLLAFAGNIGLHPDYYKIKEFCTRHKVELLSLTQDTPEDIGSIIPIYEA